MFIVWYLRLQACSTDFAFPGHRAQALQLPSRTPWGAHKQRSYISAASLNHSETVSALAGTHLYTWVEWSLVGNAILLKQAFSQWSGWESNPGPLAWQASIYTTRPLLPHNNIHIIYIFAEELAIDPCGETTKPLQGRIKSDKNVFS